MLHWNDRPSGCRSSRGHETRKTRAMLCAILFCLAAFAVLNHFAFPERAHAQDTVRLQGRVVYSTGQPAAGVTVTLKMTMSDALPPTITTESTITDGGGNYSFQEPGRCGVEYEFQATSSEIVDDEALSPSGVNSTSGCVLSDIEYGDLIINRPGTVISGGYVTDQSGAPVEGITITMTRTKGPNDNPTTATTTTDANGHYDFTTYARCGIALEMRASIGGFTFPGIASTSGCVLFFNDGIDIRLTFNDLNNAGKRNCHEMVGRPVDVTSGNVYLQQTDYQLPAAGQSITVERTYNSISPSTGLFGRGWTTVYDEGVTVDSYGLPQLSMADGRVVSLLTPDFFGQIVHNGDGSYTARFKDGRVHQFNPTGQLRSLSDRNGNQTVLAYNGSRLSSITDPFGRVVSVNTNGDGRVVSLSDSLGVIVSYTYGSANELLTVTYPDGSAYQFSYVAGPLGFILTSVADALGNIIEQHDYDPQGRATLSEAQGGIDRYTLSYANVGETDVTDALGHMTKYFHHSVQGRRVVTRVEGNCSCGDSQVQTWNYDDHLNLISTTNALNQTISYTYDADGNRLTETDFVGTTSYTHNQFGEVLTSTDKMGGGSANAFDPNGNLVSVTDALNHTATFSSNARGLLLSLTDPLNNTTSFSYDAFGDMIQRTDAKGNQSTAAYDARGRITSATDAAGNTATLTYDLAGRVTTVTRPDGTTVNYLYDLAGRLTRVTDALNNSTSLGYDTANRLTTVTDALGNLTGYSYDVMSNLTGITDALGRTTNYSYDDFNRPSAITYPEATPGAGRLQEGLAYDLGGNLIRRIDQAGRVTTYQYDGANRVTSGTDPTLKTTAVEYNARSEVTALVDAIGQRYEFSRDALGRLLQTTRGSSVMMFKYDAVGNRIRRTDYNGAVTHFGYNALNSLHKITYPDTSTVVYTYDKLERLKTATNENGTVDLKYDNMNRVKAVTDVFGSEVDYKFDDDGNRTRILLDATTIATYRYDADNRLTKTLDGAGAAFTFDYDAIGRLMQQKAANNVKTVYQYDGLDRLKRMTSTKGVATVADFQYQFNSLNNITQMVDVAGVHNYGYDAVDRLTSATHANQANETYGYDGVGNRVSSSHGAYDYQPFNRLIGANASSFTYDSNGNLVSKSNTVGTTQLAWDFENRLKRAALPNGNVVTFRYDALGRRIERAATAPTSNTARFIYDGPEVVRDTDGNGATLADYVNGPGIDNKLRQTTSATASYFVRDHLGSTRALTNANGNVVGSLAYDSFGNVVNGSAATRYTFTGREFDSDIGLYYYRARWYDPQVGRFVSEDPIRSGTNFYAYAANNPTNLVDPSGLYNEDVHFYLTNFIAARFPCLSPGEARMIAEGDQHTDEDAETSPGFGWNEGQRQVNSDHHAFNDGNNGNLNNLRGIALGRSGTYGDLGRYLHYLQDTFSHRGFYNSGIGQAEEALYLRNPFAVDYTNSDLGKSSEMTTATWFAIRDWIKAHCDCPDQGDTNVEAWWPQVDAFLEASDGDLEKKRQLLGLPRR